MRVILVRHALPRRLSAADGGADPGLVELGHRQAARAAEALVGDAPTVLCSSPMRRARETAAPLAAALGQPVRVVAGLVEFDVDRPSYLPVHEMAHLDPDSYARLRSGQLPAGVDVPAFRARVRAAMSALLAELDPLDTVVCFAHAGVINSYLSTLLGIAEPPLPFALDYTGISRVTISRSVGPRVRAVNETAHVTDLLDPASAGSATGSAAGSAGRDIDP